MIERIRLVAVRDFIATVSAKGFLIGLVIVPILILVSLALVPRLLNSHDAHITGQVEVIDPTGIVAPRLKAAINSEAIATRAGFGSSLGRTPPRESAAPIPGGPLPHITVIEHPPDESVQEDEHWLVAPRNSSGSHLAIVSVQPDAVVRAPGHAEYGSYTLYLAANVDETIDATIQNGMRKALIAARFRKDGGDLQAVESMMRITKPAITVVTHSGQRPVRPALERLLPLACAALLFLGVTMGGQLLLTSTVEEKSSRVVEVLLAAVSPVELMAGKLIGQLGVALLIVAIYVGVGLMALGRYSVGGQLDPTLVVYFVVFYLLAYIVYGGLMLAIGAAVSQVAEAQSLMGPIILLLVVPMMLVQTIERAPNAPLSVALSFIPPMNSVAILARLGSATPPPLWQVLGSVMVGLMGAVVAVWFAAKIFRIGLLMHGKPPTLATLIRWARTA